VRRSCPVGVLDFGRQECRVATYGKVDQSERTAFVPAGRYGILNTMKQTLAKDGWSLIVTAGDEKFEGTNAPGVDITKTHQRTARYRFAVKQWVSEVCVVTGTPELSYEIVLIDNKTGAEVTSIIGRLRCNTTTSDEAAQAIDAL
jgi:hypothetical protein